MKLISITCNMREVLQDWKNAIISLDISVYKAEKQELSIAQLL